MLERWSSRDHFARYGARERSKEATSHTQALPRRFVIQYNMLSTAHDRRRRCFWKSTSKRLTMLRSKYSETETAAVCTWASESALSSVGTRRWVVHLGERECPIQSRHQKVGEGGRRWASESALSSVGTRRWVMMAKASTGVSVLG